LLLVVIYISLLSAATKRRLKIIAKVSAIPRELATETTAKNTHLFALCARGHSQYPAVEISKVGVPGQREEAQVQRCAASPSPWRASSRFKHEGCVFAGLAGVASHRVATRRSIYRFKAASTERSGEKWRWEGGGRREEGGGRREGERRPGGAGRGGGRGPPSRGVAVQETFRAARRAPLRRRSSR